MAWQDKTHCPRNHPYEGYNLIVDVYKNGKKRRRCRTCDLERSRDYQARKRLERLIGESEKKDV